MKKTRSSLAALALLLTACAELDDSEVAAIAVTSQALNPGVAAGFGAVSWEYIADQNYQHLVDHLANNLSGHSISVTINVPSSQIDVMPPDTHSPWLAVDAAMSANIPVTLWLTLPEFPTPMSNYSKSLDPTGSKYHNDPAYKTTGYFANQSNAGEYVAKATALKTKFERRYPGKKAGLLIDMEIRKELMAPYKLVSPTSPADQLDFFKRYGGLGRAAEYDAALVTYKAFVTSMRNAGWRMDVSTFVQMIDDYADGDASLRRAYGAVLDDMRVAGATPWSHVYIQAYTTLYGASLPVTNYFVYDYARLTKTIFGAAAAVDVGLTHGGIDPSAPLYWSPIPLAQDTSAALAAGIPRGSIEVYSYLGLFAGSSTNIDTNIQTWLFPVPPVNLPPPSDVGTATFHTTNRAADAYFPAQ
jgi:hypothetical protein